MMKRRGVLGPPAGTAWSGPWQCAVACQAITVTCPSAGGQSRNQSDGAGADLLAGLSDSCPSPGSIVWTSILFPSVSE